MANITINGLVIRNRDSDDVLSVEATRISQCCGRDPVYDSHGYLMCETCGRTSLGGGLIRAVASWELGIRYNGTSNCTIPETILNQDGWVYEAQKAIAESIIITTPDTPHAERQLRAAYDISDDVPHCVDERYIQGKFIHLLGRLNPAWMRYVHALGPLKHCCDVAPVLKQADRGFQWYECGICCKKGINAFSAGKAREFWNRMEYEGGTK